MNLFTALNPLTATYNKLRNQSVSPPPLPPKPKKCRDCARPLSPNNKNFCEYHRVKVNARQRELRLKLKAQGKCIVCSKPQSPSSKQFCLKHWKSTLKSKKKYRQNQKGISANLDG